MSSLRRAVILTTFTNFLSQQNNPFCMYSFSPKMVHVIILISYGFLFNRQKILNKYCFKVHRFVMLFSHLNLILRKLPVFCNISQIFFTSVSIQSVYFKLFRRVELIHLLSVEIVTLGKRDQLFLLTHVIFVRSSNDCKDEQYNIK